MLRVPDGLGSALVVPDLLATQNMPSTDIYARCNFTRSGHPNIRFNVIIKVLKAKLEELRELPANRELLKLRKILS